MKLNKNYTKQHSYRVKYNRKTTRIQLENNYYEEDGRYYVVIRGKTMEVSTYDDAKELLREYQIIK